MRALKVGLGVTRLRIGLRMTLNMSLLAAIAAGTVTINSGCSSSNKPPSESTDVSPVGWADKMQALSHTLSSLLPLVASRSKFNTEANAARIEEDTRKLKSLTHSLKTGDSPNGDPTMRMMSGLFDEDITRALDALKSGNRDYARHILKDTTSYCIQCHTQANNGPNFPVLSLGIDTKELKPLERAEFFAATRQFDRALDSYVEALGDEKLAKADPFEWENAGRVALAITVRVKNDPKQTLAIVERIDKNKAKPASLQAPIKAWKKSIQAWSKEKALPADAKARLNAAKQMISAGQKKQEFPLDHSQDIAYFRASSTLHELMQTQAGGNDKDFQANALYWSGVASEATRDMNFWTLHETYYEQCIRTTPGSTIAKQCFDKLKESVTLGYSGSAGVQIPPEVAKRLEGFRAMAQNQNQNQNQSAPAPEPTTKQ